jgi:hypothetical protein
VNHANILHLIGRDGDARQEAELLSKVDALDGFSLYNLACLYLHFDLQDVGLDHLGRAVTKGFKDVELLRRDPDLAPLRGSGAFDDIVERIEKPLPHPSAATA